MKQDFYYDSCGTGKIHACRWEPDGKPRGILQIVHGIAEYVGRYEEFADYLTGLGILVVGEDHMGHGKSGSTRGYFTGGWAAAVEDSYTLLKQMKAEYPELPYILFGHSMGSMMVRTMLQRYPDSGISGAVICGTCWMPVPVVLAGYTAAKVISALEGEKNPSPRLQKLTFGTYNQRVERPRTPYDWLNRDNRRVDAYVADPDCGFTASGGLTRDMLGGLLDSEKPKNLAKMNKSLPVFFIAGGDDPVGGYGDGVRQAAEAFRKAGMERVDLRIYPLCRHEILLEINREEIFEDIRQWIGKRL